MAKMRVKTDALNLRSTPRVTSGNIIRSLPLAHEVELLGAPAANRFVAVKTRIDSSDQQGFVHADFLREPLSQPREAIISEAVKQWIRFKRGAGRETAAPYFR